MQKVTKPSSKRKSDIVKKPRCWWCGEDPLYIRYHDTEWGIPLHNDRKLFELLLLEGFQAGLSWITILRKRDNFRAAFQKFDPNKIAKFTKKDVLRLMKDEGIVRNRLKIESAITNAQAFLRVKKEFGSFDKYLWSFTRHKTIRAPKPPRKGSVRATSSESDAMSKDLKKGDFGLSAPLSVMLICRLPGWLMIIWSDVLSLGDRD